MASVAASLASLIPALAVAAFGLAACGDSNNNATPDAALPPDSGASCDPTTVLPSGYTPVAKVATTLVNVTTTAGVSSGTIDATAGGVAGVADNPYIYVDLKNGVRVDVNDVDARTSTTWDIALKRSSPHLNGGDAGGGNRKLAIVDAATLDAVTAAPTTGYTTDDYTTADCMLSALPGGEPLSAFGQWYGLQRPDPRADADVEGLRDRAQQRIAHRVPHHHVLWRHDDADARRVLRRRVEAAAVTCGWLAPR